MDSSVAVSHQKQYSSDPHESATKTASRSVQSFCTIHLCTQHTPIDIRTTPRATSVATGRIACTAYTAKKIRERPGSLQRHIRL